MKMYRTVQRVETNSGIITAAELRARLNLPPGTELIVRLDGTPPPGCSSEGTLPHLHLHHAGNH